MAEKKLFCNGCGRILKYENDILREDVFEGKKQWGPDAYFFAAF